MTQFAGIRPFPGWESLLPDKKVDALKGELIVIATETTEEEKILQLRKKKHPFYCLQCGEILRFRKEHTRDGVPIHSHFYHKDQECSPSESPDHALTKGYLFDLLKERGYTVKQEYNHRDANGRRVRADVAMLENELKLVVEVQASHGKVADAKRKMSVYGADRVPVAWVLLMDRFFRNYAIVDPRLTGDNQMIIGGEGKYTVHHPLDANMHYRLFLGGQDHALFDFLIDEYLYVIGIIANGNVLLIRRTPKSAERRERVRAQGGKWSTTDDEFDVTLIPEHRIVDVLLDTEVIEVEYEGKVSSPQVSANRFKGKDCEGEEKSKSPATSHVIDFESGKTTEDAHDPIALIRETQEAARRERIRIAEEKKREEMRKEQEREQKRKAELERKLREEEEGLRKEEEASKQLEETLRRREEEVERRQREEEEKTRKWLEQLERKRQEEQRRREEAEKRQIEEQNRLARLEEERRKNEEIRQAQLEEEKIREENHAPQGNIEEEEISEEERKQFVEQRLRQDDERGLNQLRQLAQKGYQLPRALAPKVERNMYHHATLEQTLWYEYLQIPKEQRAQWEQNQFPNGEPEWFTKKKQAFQQPKKQWMKKTDHNKIEPSNNQGEQLTLDL
ncbi:hypothetical protein [Laceyella putida]|uniref:Competence protein CoiA-like family protein n=1 Tax=Laceyella putida TaxID=110101 RepID=A0ABW2RR23_9BACL